jgi:SAM-dependent methyltransferase
MEPEVYRQMADNESRHWWYVARSEILQFELSRCFPDRRPRILDVGCGPGFLSNMLATRLGETYGCDSSPDALSYAARYPGFRALSNDALLARTDLRSSFDLLCFFDVIEHVESDQGFVQTFLPFLKPGGLVAISVPAFMALWGQNDVAAMHYRRYRGPQVDTLMAGLDFSPVRTTYFNTWLSPLFLVYRSFERLIGRGSRPATHSEGINLPPPWPNRLLERCFRSELAVLKRGRLPFGVTFLGIYKQRGPAGRVAPTT